MSWVLSVPELVRLSHAHFRCRPPRLYGFRSRQDNLAAEALPVYFIALCITLYSGYSQFLVLRRLGQRSRTCIAKCASRESPHRRRRRRRASAVAGNHDHPVVYARVALG